MDIYIGGCELSPPEFEAKNILEEEKVYTLRYRWEDKWTPDVVENLNASAGETGSSFELRGPVTPSATLELNLEQAARIIRLCAIAAVDAYHLMHVRGYRERIDAALEAAGLATTDVSPDFGMPLEYMADPAHHLLHRAHRLIQHNRRDEATEALISAFAILGGTQPASVDPFETDQTRLVEGVLAARPHHLDKAAGLESLLNTKGDDYFVEFRDALQNPEEWRIQVDYDSSDFELEPTIVTQLARREPTQLPLTSVEFIEFISFNSDSTKIALLVESRDSYRPLKVEIWDVELGVKLAWRGLTSQGTSIRMVRGDRVGWLKGDGIVLYQMQENDTVYLAPIDIAGLMTRVHRISDRHLINGEVVGSAHVCAFSSSDPVFAIYDRTTGGIELRSLENSWADRSFECPKNPAASFSPDGRLFAYSNGTGADVRDVSTGQMLVRYEHGYPVTSISWSTDGNRVITHCQSRAMIWGLDGACVGDTDSGFECYALGAEVVYIALGRVLFTMTHDFAERLGVMVYDVEIESMQISPGGTLLAIGLHSRPFTRERPGDAALLIEHVGVTPVLDGSSTGSRPPAAASS